MLVDICTKCKKRLAISDGLCNECSDKTLEQQLADAGKPKKKHYVTFGQVHTHRIQGKTLDCDTVAVFEAYTHEEGRKKAFELFGDKFFTDYHGAQWKEDQQLKWFPKGYVYLK